MTFISMTVYCQQYVISSLYDYTHETPINHLETGDFYNNVQTIMFS